MNKAPNVSAQRMPSSLNVTTDKVALFPMTENTGSTISDRTGNYPDAAMTGTSTDVLSTKAYWFNPEKRDSKFTVAPGLIPAFADDCAALFCFEFFRSADRGTGEWENIFCIRQDRADHGILMLQISANGLMHVTAAGVGASENIDFQLPTGDFDMTTYNGDEKGVRLAFLLHDFSTLSFKCSFYHDGVYLDSNIFDMTENGGTGYPEPLATGTIISGREIGDFGIGTTGRSSAMHNVLMHYQSTYDAAAMQRIIADHALDPGTIPREFLR